MKKTILRAPALTQSGYGVHARQIAAWLIKRNDVALHINAMPWGDTPWHIDSTALDGLVGAIMERTSPVKTLKGQNSISFQLQLPHEWDPNLADVNVGLTAGVETDRCSPDWIAACNRMTAIVVPSSHVEACLRASGVVTVPIHVVPESWSHACSAPSAELPKLPSFECEKNVLLFGQLTGNNPYNDRKNTFFGIRWLCELLADHPNVGIVLKTNACRNTLIDRDIVLNALKGLLAQVRKHGAGPKLQLLHGDLSDREVAALYRHPQVQCLAAPTRGEGFGLPILEAAVSGLPIVATAWSGHTDFLSSLYSDVKFQLETVHSSRVDGKIFVPTARWAAPNEHDFKGKIIELLNDPRPACVRAEKLRERVLTTHSPAAISAAYDAALSEYFK